MGSLDKVIRTGTGEKPEYWVVVEEDGAPAWREVALVEAVDLTLGMFVVSLVSVATGWYRGL